MKRVIISETENTEKETILGMANLFPEQTGLPMIIWVDNAGKDRNVPHNEPRIKVQNILGDERTDDTFVLTISKHPEIKGECKLSNKNKKLVIQYVIDHYDTLMKQWNREISEDELKDILNEDKKR